MMAAPFKLDAAGENFIAEHEGEVLYLYDDPAGFATFGIGHLVARRRVANLPLATRARYGTKAHPLPRVIARRLSRRLFRQDVQTHVEHVLREVPERWRDTPGRLTAFTSMSFNLGPGVLTPEPPLTSLGEALRGPRTPETRDRIAKAILLYDKGGVPLRRMEGLARRRRAEADLFVRSWR